MKTLEQRGWVSILDNALWAKHVWNVRSISQSCDKNLLTLRYMLIRNINIPGLNQLRSHSFDGPSHVPALNWLAGYRKDFFSGDLMAGFVVAIVLLPQAMLALDCVG